MLAAASLPGRNLVCTSSPSHRSDLPPSSRRTGTVWPRSLCPYDYLLCHFSTSALDALFASLVNLSLFVGLALGHYWFFLFSFWRRIIGLLSSEEGVFGVVVVLIHQIK